jgi:hypothetical protein
MPVGQATTKSTQLPDPPTLTDSNDPKFEDWLTRIKDKLLVNADHYPTDQIQRAYVIGRIGGEAATYIAPRLRPDSSDPYQTVADLFRHLSDIYEDPNRKYIAKDSFRKLSMRKQDPFHAFYSTFTRLANEACISPAELKDELSYKLSFDLQRQVLREARDPNYTLKQFADLCSLTDQSIKGIDERQNRTKKTATSLLVVPRYDAPRPLRPTPAMPANMMSAEKQQLAKEGKCFYCKGVGHRAFECPLKKSVPRTEVRAIEGILPESGNDSA